MNNRRIAVAALVMGAVTLGGGWVGWAWWHSQGPFKYRTTWRETERVDAMEGVEYITPTFSAGAFVDFYWVRRWGGDRITTLPGVTTLPGSDTLPLPPFLKQRNSVPGMSPVNPQDQQEARELALLKQNFTNAILAEGFQLTPYSTSARTTVSQLSQADMAMHVRTYRKMGNRQVPGSVLFQLETTIHRHVRSPFKKPALFRLAVVTYTSPVYVAAEKDALKSIQEAVVKEARGALNSSHWIAVLPADAQYDLSPDPYYVRDEDKVPSPSASTQVK